MSIQPTKQIFDIFKNYSKVLPHKRAHLIRHSDEIRVSYKGPLISSGFRILLKTTKGWWYRLQIQAKLLKGDMCFVYCESVNPTIRLIERKYFITDSINEYDLWFQSVNNGTYIGLLFYSSKQEYVLSVKDFTVESSRVSPAHLSNSLHKEIETIHKEEAELDEIIRKNNEIAQRILRENFNKDTNSCDSDDIDSIVEEYFPLNEIKSCQLSAIESSRSLVPKTDEKAAETDSVLAKAEELRAEPIVEIEAEPIVEIEAEPIVEIEAEPIIETPHETLVDTLEEPLVDTLEEPLVETAGDEASIDKITESLVDPSQLITFIVYQLSRIRSSPNNQGFIAEIIGLENEVWTLDQDRKAAMTSLVEVFTEWIEGRMENSLKESSKFLENFILKIDKTDPDEISTLGPRIPTGKKKRRKNKRR